ncbi:Protein MAIN-LIKE 2 [Linum perenne]
MSCLAMTQDLERIIVLVERWRPKTNTLQLYHGEVTITLEDMHMLTLLSVDGWPVESTDRIPSDVPALAEYVEHVL